MAINFTPYDGQGYALQNEYVSRLRLTPYGKAKVEKITSGGSCNQVKGIRIEGFNDLTEANGGYIDINSFKVFKFIFDGKPVNVKEIK